MEEKLDRQSDQLSQANIAVSALNQERRDLEQQRSELRGHIAELQAELHVNIASEAETAHAAAMEKVMGWERLVALELRGEVEAKAIVTNEVHTESLQEVMMRERNVECELKKELQEIRAAEAAASRDSSTRIETLAIAERGEEVVALQLQKNLESFASEARSEALVGAQRQEEPSGLKHELASARASEREIYERVTVLEKVAVEARSEFEREMKELLSDERLALAEEQAAVSEIQKKTVSASQHIPTVASHEELMEELQFLRHELSDAEYALELTSEVAVCDEDDDIGIREARRLRSDCEALKHALDRRGSVMTATFGLDSFRPCQQSKAVPSSSPLREIAHQNESGRDFMPPPRLGAGGSDAVRHNDVLANKLRWELAAEIDRSKRFGELALHAEESRRQLLQELAEDVDVEEGLQELARLVGRAVRAIASIAESAPAHAMAEKLHPPLRKGKG